MSYFSQQVTSFEKIRKNRMGKVARQEKCKYGFSARLLDAGLAPEGGYIPLFCWANNNNSNTDTREAVNLFPSNKLLGMHSAP